MRVILIFLSAIGGIKVKKIYQTEQRKTLIDFLSVDKSRQFTIEEIIEAMQDLDDAPGKSTVYRLMTKLTEEGIVRRFNEGSGRKFFYQIVDGKNCCRHFHMKCLRCGKLVHLDDDISMMLYEKIAERKKFNIDEQKTMLFGECEICTGKRIAE